MSENWIDLNTNLSDPNAWISSTKLPHRCILSLFVDFHIHITHFSIRAITYFHCSPPMPFYFEWNVSIIEFSMRGGKSIHSNFWGGRFLFPRIIAIVTVLCSKWRKGDSGKKMGKFFFFGKCTFLVLCKITFFPARIRNLLIKIFFVYYMRFKSRARFFQPFSPSCSPLRTPLPLSPLDEVRLP